MKLFVLALLLVFIAPVHAGEIFHYADLNTREIAGLDAANAVVVLPGGLLEQHGPYLPSGTDSLVSRYLADALAKAIIERTDHDVVMLPMVYLGTDSANVIGERHPYPGSLDMRPETLRQVFLDYGDALGEAGFRKIFIVHGHGAPRHNLMLDQAEAYFRDTWGGAMVHLSGIDAVKRSVAAARNEMSDEAIAAQGFSVHGAAQEHAHVLYLRPDLVAADYKSAPDWRAEDFKAMFAMAYEEDWPGYFGAPRYATREMGEASIEAKVEEAIAIALDIIAGANPAKYPRISAQRQPEKETKHAKRQRERQEAWLEKNDRRR